MNRWPAQMLSYAKFAVDFFVLGRDRVYVLGLVTNDTCNLNCEHCRVANVHHSSMTLDMIKSVLERYYRKGVRFLYLEGGEPCLWRDGNHRLKDVIKLAREIGYLRIHLYTNGTVRTDAEPDFTWFSIDGLDDAFQKIRGIPLERVLRNVRDFTGRHAVVFVVNTVNYRQIRSFLEYFDQELNGTKVMFYFHTPYYGVDELFLSPPQRKAAVDTLLDCKKDGLPVLNSRAALNDYLSGNKELPVNYWWIVDQQGEYRCCRANDDPDICKVCGYSTCREMLLARKWNPAAIAGLLKTF